MRREVPTTDIDQESEVTRAMQAVQDAMAVFAAALQGQRQKQQQKPAAPPPASKVEQRTKAAAIKPQGGRGRPPPPEFDFEKLPDSQLLTETEVAAIGRWSTNTLSCWRQRGDHPLKWVVVGGRVRYTVRDLRQFIASGYSVPRGRPRKPNAMSGAQRARLFRRRHGNAPRETNAAPARQRMPAKPPAPAESSS